MLDTETKRRIDTARDILVGKVPDPKSQVEQITIALIYKFMDDMDSDSEELGGKRKFFDGDFARYGWAKLMRSGLGGHEALNLYAEAIAKMPENPGIPPLFRDIFKNAYLPYRDPETLRAFLKIIDEFEYDHSERLGDAFEYLLSVLGSQGDAGQFRTPRHIIDFMVKVVDPKKNETVLDPACGTAGFLISSYKHIRQTNMDEKGNSTLTPDEKGRLAKNFKGYDISPDMVRLSLVNMYLHGFVAPEIYEYDTLTSMERWNDYADVILANPPFMSPKGGIRPHNRFSVKSKRSEVLFVDYMSEHLSSTGRAGIIVPEGIIFQSQKAYKQLRKMLVEEFLVAVISLPAGVFNPYSGVKTSILILDKSLARKTKYIGFFKVDNDGFNLGAQRRQIDKNDLPKVQAELAEYMNKLRVGEPVDEFQPTHGLIVEKEKIASNGEFNLSGERYRTKTPVTSNFTLVPLSSVARVKNGFAFKSKEYVDSGLRVIRIKNVQKGKVVDDDPKFVAANRAREFYAYTLKAGDILMSLTGNVGRVGRLKSKHEPAVLNQRVAHVELNANSTVLERFLFEVLNTNIFEKDAILASSGIAQANLSSKWVSAYQIPLPPLEVQKEIVEEIEGYQKVIDGARAVVENYKPHIPIDPEWPIVALGDFASNLDSRRVPITKAERNSGAIPYYGASGIVDYVEDFLFDEEILLVSEDGANLLARSTPIAFSVSGKCWVNNHAHVLKFKNVITQHFVEIYLNSISIREFVTGSAQPKLNQKALNRIPIPLPKNFSIQQMLISEIETEQAIVDANRDLIARFERKIQSTLSRVWSGDEASLGEE